MPTLKKFEGKDVVGAAMKITRAGDGLSEALELAPEIFKPGEKVTLVLEGVVADVVYKAVPNTEAMKRVHVLRTERIVRIPPDDATAYFQAEAERLAKLRDEAEGVTRLPLGDDPLGIFGGSSIPTSEEVAAERQAEADEVAG